jgi:hypothetical protein
MASSITPQIVKVLRTSRRCWRYALASSFGLSENIFPCTMLINTDFSSKFLSPTVVVGQVGTLVGGDEKLADRPLGHWF